MQSHQHTFQKTLLALLSETDTLKSEKEISMQARTCSKCGSHNVYKNTGKNWHQDGVVLQMIAVDRFTYRFETDAYLCLDCRYLEILVSETNTMYGDQKTLTEVVQASNNWAKA